eukprot:CAMPEP_0196737774 /NCGR_PEP_ID=MMETSP1091-20130531/15400_1 /TAXON_ID=302021 /ORGANISM="Rhodomonas sp., Strain CCMP768" /LENGTH=140 /DNA_ID=CAMNT_0042081669 /DNA_START=13 /DNA_END=431 /DNA_ORIENTATION=-
MAAQWQFEDKGRWVPFDSAAASKCERAFQAKQRETFSTFVNPRTHKPTVYTYDLERMTQVNEDTGFERRIQRTDCAAGGTPFGGGVMGALAGAIGFVHGGPVHGSPPPSSETIEYSYAPVAPADAVSVEMLTEWTEVEDV